MKLSYISL